VNLRRAVGRGEYVLGAVFRWRPVCTRQGHEMVYAVAGRGNMEAGAMDSSFKNSHSMPVDCARRVIVRIVS